MPPSGRARLTFRAATVADLDVLVDHRHRMWSEIRHHTEPQIDEHDPRYRTWARARFRSGELAGFVAERPDGTAVGSGLVWFRPEQPRPGIRGMVTPYVLSMFTEPAWRGKGVATRIMRELLALVRRRGHPDVVLHASRFGRGVYRRVGFERTWEMRYWIDRRIPRSWARLTAPPKQKRKKGLDRAR